MAVDGSNGFKCELKAPMQDGTLHVMVFKAWSCNNDLRWEIRRLLQACGYSYNNQHQSCHVRVRELHPHWARMFDFLFQNEAHWGRPLKSLEARGEFSEDQEENYWFSTKGMLVFLLFMISYRRTKEFPRACLTCIMNHCCAMGMEDAKNMVTVSAVCTALCPNIPKKRARPVQLCGRVRERHFLLMQPQGHKKWP